jgi:small subunit ribosomal protein S3
LGQKVNPIGIRVTVHKNWRSRWYAEKKDFGSLLHEDLFIRDFVKQRFKDAAIADTVIERSGNRVRITLHSGRPGAAVGRRYQEQDRFREELASKLKKEVQLVIQEVKNPDTNAQLVAENIALQLERRVSFRRAMKRAVQMAMEMGVLGIKVHASGRLGGAELARREWYREGKVPLHTFRANVEYGFAEARTVAGAIGIKVWICQPEAQGTAQEVKRHAAYA